MLKIRLQRVGRKHDASFRMVVTDSRRGPKAGNSLEVVGVYDPKRDITKIDADRVKHWISVGAQVSDTAHNLLISEKVIKGNKVNVLPKKSPIVTEGADEAAPEEKPAETSAEETPAEAPVEAPAEDTPAETSETPEETPKAEEDSAEPEEKAEAEEEKKD